MTASPLAQTPNDMFNAPIAEADPEIAEILDAELSRQQNGLEMIASENFVPRAVLQAQGSVLTNKYAEGYPGRRYYGGCEQVDKIETIAQMSEESSAAAGQSAETAKNLDQLAKHMQHIVSAYRL